MKIYFDSGVRREFSWKRHIRPLSWVLSYGNSYREYGVLSGSVILWSTKESAQSLKNYAKNQHNIKLIVEKYMNCYILILCFSNEADEAEFIMKMS